MRTTLKKKPKILRPSDNQIAKNPTLQGKQTRVTQNNKSVFCKTNALISQQVMRGAVVDTRVNGLWFKKQIDFKVTGRNKNVLKLIRI